MCFFLEGVTTPKSGQIAHLDQDPTNDEPENLAWLCLEHHDLYDSRTSQSKGLTFGEVRRYRDELHALIQRTAPQAVLPSHNAEGKPQPGLVSSADWLSRIIEAYDREERGRELGQPPNGIALGHLAEVAAREAGDFGAALEAFVSLLRLAGGGDRQAGRVYEYETSIVSANPVTASARILRLFSDIDSGLFHKALGRGCDYSLMGDVAFRDLDAESPLPHASFCPYVQILCAFLTSSGSPPSVRSAEVVSNEVAKLLMRSALLLVLRGSEVPAPPRVIYVNPSGRRCEQDVTPEDLPPFVWVAHEVAKLPQPIFEYTVKRLSFMSGLQSPYQDAATAVPLPQALLYVRKWALWQSGAAGYMALATESDVARAGEAIEAMKALGLRVAAQVRAFVEGERRPAE